MAAHRTTYYVYMIYNSNKFSSMLRYLSSLFQGIERAL